MVMNTQQLFYLTEIERTRSISQAAENLYMSQPNLSRLLRETEESIGFAIFQRTRRGVQPTEKGQQFLRHAKNVLREMEFMERLGPNHNLASRFRVYLPRSQYYLNLTWQYLHDISPAEPLDAVIREGHPRQGLELLSNCDVDIAVIRYATEYQAYFEEQTQSRDLRLTPLKQVEFQILLSENDPLSQKAFVTRQDLENHTELLHRDIFCPGQKGKRSIYLVDRLAQLQMLQAMPGCYTWSEPLPEDFLRRYGLVQRPCSDGYCYQDALVYKPQCAMSELEAGFLNGIMKTEK